MTRINKIGFIKRIVAELGEIQLGNKCGKYYSIVDNGNDVIAISFAGKYGYNTTKIEEVSPKDINIIYEDIKQDFE